MKSMQDRIQKFNDDRGWSTFGSTKDLLLNMNEEIGEFWNVIKWVDTEKQKELVEKHKDEVENFVGDMLFLTLKISHLCDVDSQKAIEDVMDEYEKRFPIDKVKGSHANTRAGGYDNKQK